MKIDTAVSAINNLMFLSYDPDAYYNEDAYSFPFIVSDPIPMAHGGQDLQAIAENALSRSGAYVKGNRNNAIHRIASYMNYYGVTKDCLLYTSPSPRD